MKFRNLALICLVHATTFAQVLVPQKATWKYLKGTTAPSSPTTAWREAGFNDGAWLGGAAPIYYGETLVGGTVLSDMRNNYTTFFARKTFSVANAAAVDRLALRIYIDDGYVVWINGREVARYNVTAGEQSHTNVAVGSATEPIWTTNSLARPSEYLVDGQNVIAVHVLNRAVTSTDIAFELELDATTDTAPPSIAQLQPAPGTVSELNSLTIIFSEPVQGVFAEELLINNTPAISVTGSGTTYTYTFAQPDLGPVDITFDAGQRIADLADPPHPFDASGFVGRYILSDETAPFIETVVPLANATVRQLNTVEVKFSEAVFGLEAADLLINGQPATNVLVRPSNTYVFQFPGVAAGAVNIAWAVQHGIHDRATNAFVAGSWSYVVDPALPVAQVIISEFLAAAENATGYKDEDGELQDWIEIHNTGTTAVNLAGWSLTDDPEEPGLWTFPNVTLSANARLVVFASAKDRKPTAAGSRLHTNFKLGNGGEYLALFNADSPRAATTEFQNDYPEQRNDYSYGVDANGQWRYFQIPTPGQPNGSSSITGVVPKPDVSHKRGWYEAPFTLTLTNVLAGTTIRYTTDGSVPTETSGSIYTAPLQISSNLILRAIASRPNNLPSEILTHTYLFAEHVLRQPNDPAGFPVGATVQAGYPSDYEMDPEIVDDPLYAAEMKDALMALPVISISMKMDDMFGAVNGIYTHPLNRGPQWERLCSLEFIPTDGKDFQVDAGIQIQGNAAREPIKTPKHPMRVTFKGDYGPKKLDYRMFPDSPVSSFDTLILRADFGYSWLHWNPFQRVRAQRTRDAWVKDTMRAMGGLASHNRYVHLFINGVYWGVYDPTERPDGSFGEAYLGGEKEDYDVMNEGAVVDGSATAYNTMIGMTDISTIAQYDAMKTYLDMPQFIDYMLLHFFIGHEDWFRNKNWYAIRPKDGSRGFLYIPWDGENVLVDPTANKVSATDLPSGLHPRLILNEQYRLDFADRVHRHFFNGGALTATENIARWQKRAREIELPIIAESARWGDYRRDVHQYQSPPYELYTREAQYRTEQNRLINTYFPNRTTTVWNQLRAAGLYPSVAGPAFNQFGGKIDPGFQLRMTAGAGAIYYTTNNIDPRVYGTGAVSPSAKTYSGSITLNASVHVKARLLSNGIWSALTEATFNAESPRIPLRITELMYNPDPAGDAYEYIELQNFSALPFDATGYFIQGVDYIFPPQTIIPPGEIIVLGSADNPTRFAERYTNVTVFGRFGGQLLNRGERLALVAPNGRTAQSVDYGDSNGWPEGADGEGYSLEVTEAFGDPDDPSNWHSSAALLGTPGGTNSGATAASVVINEIYSSGTPDWVELHNRTASAINLAGWTLEDSGNTNVFVFPAGSSIPANGYATVNCDPFSIDPLVAHFGLDRQKEQLVLRNNSGGVVDVFFVGTQVTGKSAGRINGRIELTLPTPGAANTAEQLDSPASLVLNEWLADAAPGRSDWIELHNTNPDSAVSLRGLFLTISNQVFEICSASFVGPGGYVQLFADELSESNSLDFKLPATGGTVQLLDAGGRVLTSFSYTQQAENISEGRFPDATDNIMRFPVSPTPGASNSPRFPVMAQLTNGEIALSWSSTPSRIYRIEISGDLLNWSTHKEVTAAETTMVQRESAQSGNSFFRIVALP